MLVAQELILFHRSLRENIAYARPDASIDDVRAAAIKAQVDGVATALDSVSEKAIQQALTALTHGRTAIMIAHWLSTILDADRILVFGKGAIAEQGARTADQAQKRHLCQAIYVAN